MIIKQPDLDRIEEQSKNPMVKQYGITWTLYKCETCRHLEDTGKSFRCSHHSGRHWPTWDACGLYVPKHPPLPFPDEEDEENPE